MKSKQFQQVFHQQRRLLSLQFAIHLHFYNHDGTIEVFRISGSNHCQVSKENETRKGVYKNDNNLQQ